jgi:elongator complex protein 3
VGLTIETRPDWITPDEILRLRHLGVTRIQIGVQSLDDQILALNQRGHDVAAVRRACRLLRTAGFKLHLHWMPNLLGATPESDLADFGQLWSDPDLRPDELKIYPCALLAGTKLHSIWQDGGYQPYDAQTLVTLLAECKAQAPAYCRLSRVIRDIPASYIVAGNRLSNLREAAQKQLASSGRRCQCIRCREIRHQAVEAALLRQVDLAYDVGVGTEHFLSLETPDGRLAGFLRLLLPAPAAADAAPRELRGSAVIREVHVYGPALHIGASSAGEAQHLGVGSRLIKVAAARAQEAGFHKMAVIAAIGTRAYYRGLGFRQGELYMHIALEEQG